MPADLTRTSQDLRQRYKAVVMQQGRVILDRDFNAMQEIVDGRLASAALDEIGQCGTPDDGFAIGLPEAGASASVSLSYSSPQPWDFTIAPGTMYVGGQRLVLPPPALGQPPWSYFYQPDWLDPPPPAGSGLGTILRRFHEYVYLRVHEQDVGAVEDPDLLDVALGGPDTTQRVRLMARVHRRTVDADDCATALAQAEADWAAHGLAFDPATMRLLPQVALQVGFAAAPATSNPCDPTALGGYLGADNQLIRLQIGAPSGGQPQLLWGYDDASFLYRISPVAGGLSWQLSQPPVDAFHIPQPGQLVEILRTAAILGTAPDATDPTGQRTIVRCVAEPTGFVTNIVSYSNTDNTVTLNPPPPMVDASDPNPLFLRIWQGQQPIDLSLQPITLIDPTTGTSPGIQVTISVPAGGPKGATLPVGAFWMVAVRPSTPQAVYPEQFLTGPQPPDGPRQWVCPLAVIEWEPHGFASLPASSAPPAQVIDCRQRFCNLVSVCNRPSGCCTITVGPTDAGGLQAILDQAAGKGQPVTACLLPGTYNLPQTLRFDSRHAGLVLEACHGGATIQADPSASPAAFDDGLIALVGADRVTLRGLTLIPTPTSFTPDLTMLQELKVNSVQGITFLVLIAVRPVDCRELTLQDCRVEFPALALGRGQVVFAVGLFAAGDCTGLEICGCHFASGIAPTSTILQSNVGSVDRGVLETTAGPHVALFGVLAVQGASAATSDIIILRKCTLDAATFRDNRFSNLTIPILANAALGTIEVRDNRVAECLCGIWLWSYGFSPFMSSAAMSMLIASASFAEIALALELGPIYPLPTDSASSGLPGAVLLTASREEAAEASVPPGAPAPKIRFALLTTIAGTAASIPPASVPVPPIDDMPLTLRLVDTNILSSAAAATPAPAAVTLTGNSIEALPADPSALGSTAVLVILVDTLALDPNAFNQSLVIASNQIHARPPLGAQLSVPAVALVQGGPAAVTGNLILNANSGGGLPWSLLVFPPPQETSSAFLLAVTGNVLLGWSNLDALVRTDIVNANDPMSTWAPFNYIARVELRR